MNSLFNRMLPKGESAEAINLLSRLTKQELAYVITNTSAIIKLAGGVKSEEAHAVINYFKEEKLNIKSIMKAYADRSVTMTKLHPLAVVDSAIARGAQIDAMLQASERPNSFNVVSREKINGVEKVGVSPTLGGMLKAPAEICPDLLEDMSSPAYMPLVNACIWCAALTKFEPHSGPVAAVQMRSMAALMRAPFTEAALDEVITFLRKLSIKHDAGLTGLEWAKKLYTFIRDQKDDALSLLFSSRIVGSLASPAAVREFNEREKALFKDKVNMDLSEMRLQKMFIPVDSVVDEERDQLSALNRLMASRMYRGSDEKGQSGLFVNSYFGFLVSKDNMKVQRKLQVLQELRLRGKRVSIMCKDVREALILQEFLISEQVESVTFIGFTTEIDGATVSSSRTAMSGTFHIDFNSMAFPSKSKTTSFDSYSDVLERTARDRIKENFDHGCVACAIIAPLVLEEMAAIPLYRYTEEGRTRIDYRVVLRPHPSAHNLQKIVIVEDETGVDEAKRRLSWQQMTNKTMAEISLAANMFRDTYLFHRIPVNICLQRRNMPWSPWVPMRLDKAKQSVIYKALMEDFDIQEWEAEEIYRDVKLSREVVRLDQVRAMRAEDNPDEM